MASDVMDTGNLQPDGDSAVGPLPSAHLTSRQTSKAPSPPRLSPPSYTSPSISTAQPHTQPQLYQPIPHAKPPSPRASLQLRRHRSYTTVPVESLARKLSRQSLHPAESLEGARKRHPSLELHHPELVDEVRRLPSLNTVERYHTSSPRHSISSSAVMRHSLYAMPQARHDIPMRGVHHTQATTSTASSSSRHMPPPVSYQNDIRALPQSHNPPSLLAADEGYCDGEEDLSWLDGEHAAVLGLAGNYARRGTLSFRTSQEAAMQCSTVLVRNTPRMRRRRRRKQGRRMSTATDISTASDLESIVSLPTSLSSVSLAAMVSPDHYVQ